MADSGLTLHFFGLPRFERAGTPLAVTRRKGVALLAYLATVDRPQSRDLLATLLWPGYSQRDARGNLRRTLHTLKSAIGDDVLQITPNELALVDSEGIWCDVRVFQRMAPDRPRDGGGIATLQEMVGLYQGDFLTGFSLADSAEFDAWQMRTADLLQALFLDASDRLITAFRQQRPFNEAIAIARHVGL